jgi:hypothetical protein
MGMGAIQFYRNKYYYPHYCQTITPYGVALPSTPIGMNFRSGTLRVKGDMTDFMSCNYLAFSRDGEILYAWIEDVKFRTEDSFEVSYSVDAWRTYRNKINLGTQFVARRPGNTNKRDRLLGASVDYPDIQSIGFPIGDPSKRVFVIQVRPGVGTPFSRSPVNPTPYQLFMTEYEVNNWTASTHLQQLMTKLTEGAETQNIVTMYSIPYMDLSTLPTMPLPITTASSTVTIDGFRFLGTADPSELLHIKTTFSLPMDIDDLLRVNHSVQLVIPEAGIIHVPDELLVREDLELRQDIDLFSGASNYMLTTSDGSNFTQSVRGSSISSIPVVSDPLDTYLSQNQNALATSLLGDVASIAGGAAAMVGAPGIGAAIGAGSVASGVKGILFRDGQIEDATSKWSNPPAFLGTAMAASFNNQFWLVVSKAKVENADQVHENFGYAYGMIAPLVFPASGFIQTEGCTVMSTDGSVPKWALDEINNHFNNGIRVHTS